jgi:hypothetical protein
MVSLYHAPGLAYLGLKCPTVVVLACAFREDTNVFLTFFVPLGETHLLIFVIQDGPWKNSYAPATDGTAEEP